MQFLDPFLSIGTPRVPLGSLLRLSDIVLDSLGPKKQYKTIAFSEFSRRTEEYIIKQLIYIAKDNIWEDPGRGNSIQKALKGH